MTLREPRSHQERENCRETRLLNLLRRAIAKLKPPPPSRRAQSVVNTPKDLEVWTNMLMKTDATRKPLQSPYEGLHKILERRQQTPRLNGFLKQAEVFLSRGKHHKKAE